MSAWPDSTYKSPHQTRGLFGGKVAVAVLDGMVLFKSDNGSGAWNNPAVEVAAISTSSKKVNIRLDGDVLIVSNYIDFHYQSFDYGRTWEPI